MKYWIRHILIFWVLAAPSLALADSYATLDSLVARGNRAYEQGQKMGVLSRVDSIASVLISDPSIEGDPFRDYLVSLHKLNGNYFYLNDDMPRAAYYYELAREIMQQYPETDYRGNRFGVLLDRELAQLFYRMGMYEEAAEALERVDGWLEERIYEPGDNNWLITKLTYALTLARLGEFERALSMADEELKRAKDKSDKNLDYARAKRMAAKIKLLADADSKGMLKAYKEYFAVQKKAATANFSHMTSEERAGYWQTLRPFMTDCYSMEDTDPTFSYDVVLFSKGLLLQLDRFSGNGPASRQALKSLEYTSSNIQKKLKKGDAAIEFLDYEKDGKRKMAALVLKKSGKVKFIPIGMPQQIEEVAGENLNGMSDGKNEIYENKEFQNLIWTPELLAELKDVKRIFFAPDGYVQRIAVEYLPQVADKEMYRLSSTRRLMEPVRKIQPGAPMLLMGRINYDYNRDYTLTDSNDDMAFAFYRTTFFPKLNEEIDETNLIYRLRNNPADTIFSTADASELEFRRRAPEYSMILLSTHGDFMSSETPATDVKEIFDYSDLSENIFALAGVNATLGDDEFNSRERYDGLISAAELSKMNLEKCGLFCISACQSGMGEITPDGVFGLQRGLKNAGVDAILVSLWNVNSLSSSVLMTLCFYNMEKGMSLAKSFREARKSLINDTWKDDYLALFPEEEEVVYSYNPAVMAGRYEKGGIVDLIRFLYTDYSLPQYCDPFILIDALPYE